ncbi:hypothetical protein HDU67_003982, partial [Dinochytrium kinnereticum]
LSAVKELLQISRTICTKRRRNDYEAIETVIKVERRLATFEGLRRLKTSSTNDDLRKHIFMILDSLPDSSAALFYIPWIRDEVTPLLKGRESQIRFVEWVEAKVRKIESSAQPHDALKFFSLVNALLFQKDVSTLTSAFVANTVTPRAYPLAAQRSAALLEADLYNFKEGIGKRLFVLKEQLQDIVFLWDEHNLRIPLQSYAAITTDSIAIDFLHRATSNENLKVVIENNFLPYVKKHALDGDKLFEEYCSDLLESLGWQSVAFVDY